MLDLRDISIEIVSAAHGKYGPSWGGDSPFSDPFARLYYVAGGAGTIDHHGRRFELQEGGLYLIPPLTIGVYRCDPYIDLYWVHLTAQAFGVASIFSLVEPYFEKDINDIPYAPDLFKILVSSWKSDDPSTQLELDGILRLLLARFYAGRYEVADREKFRDLMRMKPVLDYIDNNLGKSIELADLAEIVHLHPHYLSNLFKDIIRTPPMTYLLERRIEKAQQLLSVSQSSVKEIAQDLGFDDAFYFSRAFKKIVGMPPSDYRKDIQERGRI